MTARPEISATMDRLYRVAEKAAATDVNICISGETGTGKGVLAKHIHLCGDRSDKPFLRVNCAALPDQLLESMLFGHEAGAFTDARTARRGLFRAAHGGTLFLDEIGDMPIRQQAKLLHVIEQKRVRPLGRNTEIPVDVRIIAATNRDLRSEATDGTFRQDLYFRLSVIHLEVPPLRHRPEDIGALARQFVARFAGQTAELSPGAEKILLRYRWPGNVRELEHVVQRACIFRSNNLIRAENLNLGNTMRVAESPATCDLRTARRRAMRRFESDYLTGLLETYSGNITQAAAAAGVSRQALHKMLSRHQIKANIFRATRER